MSSARVLITCPQMQNCIEDFRWRFDEQDIEITMPDVLQQPSEDELIAIIGEFDGMIAGDDPLSLGETLRLEQPLDRRFQLSLVRIRHGQSLA